MSEEQKDNLIKEVCKELGITQKELAEQLDIPQSTVSRWASNEEMPKMAKMYFELLLNTNQLKEKFEILRKAHKILAE